VSTAPSHGTLSTITGKTCLASGQGTSCTASITYTPATNYNGSDSFAFIANDGSLTSAPALVSITVTPGTQRVSVATNGTQSNGMSEEPIMSADGRYVAFDSPATNLVAGDTNAVSDIFVYDRQAAQLNRVSVSTSGAEANGSSSNHAISGNGRYVAFTSQATNLVTGDTNNATDIFVRDTCAGVPTGCTPTTARVSVTASGAQANGASDAPAISADGRYIAFSSSATNLVSGDTNGATDIFVRDTCAGVSTGCTPTTLRVSVTNSGAQANGASDEPAITPDGRYVGFRSAATNLVTGDTNKAQDIFVRDRTASTTSLVSVSSSGAQQNANVFEFAMSADGNFVAFRSNATNLVTGDTNGAQDVFVRDRAHSVTQRVSVGTGGAQSNGDSFEATISGDGRYVGFRSNATNLVSGDTNGKQDIFIYDRTAGVTVRESISSTGTQANSDSFDVTLSSDGHFVAFRSSATNLVSDDTNGNPDVFVRPNP
jgi:Tol biopolymer transport system component